MFCDDCVNDMTADALFPWISGSSVTMVLKLWQHQAITWTTVGLPSEVFRGIHIRAISQQVFMNLIRNMFLGSMLLKLLPHLPGSLS